MGVWKDSEGVLRPKDTELVMGSSAGGGSFLSLRLLGAGRGQDRLPDGTAHSHSRKVALGSGVDSGRPSGGRGSCMDRNQLSDVDKMFLDCFVGSEFPLGDRCVGGALHAAEGITSGPYMTTVCSRALGGSWVVVSVRGQFFERGKSVRGFSEGNNCNNRGMTDGQERWAPELTHRAQGTPLTLPWADHDGGIRGCCRECKT